MYVGAPMLGANILTIFRSSWWILPLSIKKCPLGSFFMALLFEVYLVLYEYWYPGFFFSCTFAWKIYFQPFTFSLCRSFNLRWVSSRQHMCGSCFLIHSALPCLLIGAFNPFTFKVIIDRYLFIDIFFVPAFLSLCLLLPLLKALHLASLADLLGGGVLF